METQSEIGTWDKEAMRNVVLCLKGMPGYKKQTRWRNWLIICSDQLNWTW